MIELYLNGKSGKMGETIINLIKKNKKFNLTGNLSTADVVIDFSHPDSTKKIIEETLEKNVPLVIGTTGLNNEILENMNKASIKIPIIQAANMSIGVHQLKESIKKFVIENKNKVNCYIEEIHHVKKLDKPSGTAVEIEKLIRRIDSENNIDIVEISSIRKDDINGIHTVTFVYKDISYIFKHNATSRDIFATGALNCAQKIINLQPKLYSFEDIVN